MRSPRLLAAVLTALCAATPVLAEDRLFHHDNQNLQQFDGRPMWDGAAVCAAFEGTVERQIELRRARWAEQFSHLTPEDQANPRYAYPEQNDVSARDVAIRARQKWREFALMRLARDRPHQDGAVVFDYRVFEARPRIEASLSSIGDVERFAYSCMLFRQAVEWNRIRMMRGWPDQTDGN